MQTQVRGARFRAEARRSGQGRTDARPEQLAHVGDDLIDVAMIVAHPHDRDDLQCANDGPGPCSGTVTPETGLLAGVAEQLDHRRRRSVDETAERFGAGSTGVDEQEEIAVHLDRFDVAADRRLERATRVPFALRSSRHGTVDLIDQRLGKGVHQRGLVADRAVEDRFGHGGTGGDVIHRRIGSLTADDGDCSSEDTGPVGDDLAALGAAGSAPRGGRGNVARARGHGARRRHGARRYQP